MSGCGDSVVMEDCECLRSTWERSRFFGCWVLEYLLTLVKPGAEPWFGVLGESEEICSSGRGPRGPRDRYFGYIFVFLHPLLCFFLIIFINLNIPL